jgi:hypothetical protein
MSENSSRLVAFLAIAGLIMLGAAFYLSQPKEKVTEAPLAQVIREAGRESGSVQIITQGFAETKNVASRATMGHLDSLETDGVGLAGLQFENGYRLLILENSLITLEALKGPANQQIVVVILKRGDLKVETLGRSGTVLIGKNGQRIDAIDYNESELKNQKTTAPLAEPDLPASPQSVGSLSETEISASINLQRNAFFRCYTQLLQKDPEAKGQLAFNLVIEGTGKLSQTNIVNSSFSDLDFKNCLLDVLKRVEFRAFDGPAMSTLFPMKFE